MWMLGNKSGGKYLFSFMHYIRTISFQPNYLMSNCPIWIPVNSWFYHFLSMWMLGNKSDGKYLFIFVQCIRTISFEANYLMSNCLVVLFYFFFWFISAECTIGMVQGAVVRYLLHHYYYLLHQFLLNQASWCHCLLIICSFSLIYS